MSNLWKVFLDDSGDEKKLKFIIVGAVFGNASAWNEFNKVWRKTLHRAPRIEHFHYKEFIRLKGQFLQFRDPVKWPGKAGSMAANEKRAALEDVIAKSDLTSYGVALNVSDYQQARDSEPNAKMFLGKDPWVYALQEVAFEIARSVVEYDRTAKVTFISDDSSSAAKYSKAYVGFKKKNRKIARNMKGLSHASDEKWYGLQVADLIASATKKVYEEAEKETRKSFEDLLKSRPLLSTFAKLGYIDRERLNEVIANQSINKGR